MTHKGLVINKGTPKKPDLWMISFEDFTEEELAPFAEAMKRLKLAPMPTGVNVRWRKVYPKAVVLAALERETERQPRPRKRRQPKVATP